jgi:hypothetical protein
VRDQNKKKRKPVSLKEEKKADGKKQKKRGGTFFFCHFSLKDLVESNICKSIIKSVRGV